MNHDCAVTHQTSYEADIVQCADFHRHTVEPLTEPEQGRRTTDELGKPVLAGMVAGVSHPRRRILAIGLHQSIGGAEG